MNKNEYRISYTNGNQPLVIKAYDVSKVENGYILWNGEENGYILWNGLDGGLTFLNGKYIEKVELIKYEEVLK